MTCKHLIEADSWDRETDTWDIVKVCGYENKFIKSLCIEEGCVIDE